MIPLDILHQLLCTDVPQLQGLPALMRARQQKVLQEQVNRITTNEWSTDSLDRVLLPNIPQVHREVPTAGRDHIWVLLTLQEFRAENFAAMPM